MEGRIKKGGRKPANDPAIYRYGIKLNSVDNVKFEALFLKSGMKNKADFIKSMIFGREMKVVKIDKAAMDYYMRLTHFYSEYRAIGVNYNQVVKAIHTSFGDKRAISLLNKLQGLTFQLVKVSQKIIELTNEFEKKWLQ